MPAFSRAFFLVPEAGDKFVGNEFGRRSKATAGISLKLRKSFITIGTRFD